MKSMKKEKKAVPLQINVQWQDPTHENGRATYSVYVDKKTMSRINEVREKLFFGIVSRHQIIRYLICLYLYGGGERFTFADSCLIHNDFKNELTDKRNGGLTETETIKRMILNRLPVLEERIK